MINGIDGLVGEYGIVNKVITRIIPGVVKARDDFWPAITLDLQNIEPETVVFIIAIDKGNLVVTRDHPLFDL